MSKLQKKKWSFQEYPQEIKVFTGGYVQQREPVVKIGKEEIQKQLDYCQDLSNSIIEKISMLIKVIRNLIVVAILLTIAAAIAPELKTQIPAVYEVVNLILGMTQWLFSRLIEIIPFI